MGRRLEAHFYPMEAIYRRFIQIRLANSAELVEPDGLSENVKQWWFVKYFSH